MIRSNVYIIDSDPAVLSNVASLPFSVSTYASGEEFLTEKKHTRDEGCVITELRLRGMSGLVLLETLRQQGDLIPVILVTAFARTRLTVRSLYAGAFDVLDKPVDDKTLWETAHNAIQYDQEIRTQQRQARIIESQFQDLSEKETVVMTSMLNGVAIDDVAQQLGLALITTKALRYAVLRKTGTKSVAELVCQIEYLNSLRRSMYGLESLWQSANNGQSRAIREETEDVVANQAALDDFHSIARNDFVELSPSPRPPSCCSLS